MGRRFRYIFVPCLLGIALLSPGCKKGVPAETKVFETAPAQVKSSWKTAMAAMKTNGYAIALSELQGLRMLTDLTPKQSEIVDDTSRALTDQLYAAVDKGDQKAKQELESLRSNVKR